MSFSVLSNDRIDVTDTEYKTASVAVSTTQVEAKADTVRLFERQSVMLYNKGPGSVYFGPDGVVVGTGVRLFPFQTIKVMVGDIGLFLISDTSTDVVVQELS